MKTNDICEALYALPGGVVEARRRPVVKPLAIALAGAALLVVDTVATDSDSGNLDAAMLLIGSTMLLWGLIAATTRLFGQDRVPYYRPDGVYLRRKERYYRHQQLTELRRHRGRPEGDRRAARDECLGGHARRVRLSSQRDACTTRICLCGVRPSPDRRYCNNGCRRKEITAAPSHCRAQHRAGCPHKKGRRCGRIV